MKHIKLYVSLVIVSVSMALSYKIISDSIVAQRYNNDYAELNNIKYGLLSITEWKLQLTSILEDEINKLDLSKSSVQHLRKEIETLLYALIDSIDKKIKKENAGPVGWVKQNLMSIFVSLKQIKKGVPTYADALIVELTKSRSSKEVKSILKGELEKYFNGTYETMDKSRLEDILNATNSTDIQAAKFKLDEMIFNQHRKIFMGSLILISFSIFLFALFGFDRKSLAPYQVVILIADLLALLTAGVTTPMINVEALISHISIMLMGHNIHFDNQILYFQSKSILNVFEIMIRHKDIAMKLVGILVVTFSVIFPISKMVSSMGYYFNFHGARENPVIKFFVMKSGKWSMADVMVVAIFMAYIGFNGIINAQLCQLCTEGPDLAILTTNGSSLQPGYLLFLSYTLLALFLSGFLSRRPCPPPAKKQ
jgi:hypothetical protein